MKFGIFYELSVPRPWDNESERTVFENAFEQVRLADELGFDQVWAVEHHFLEEYSHCSAPELFLTACAVQTKSIRVGHGIVTCVREFNHPIRIAERAATLDIISGGRLEFGTGRSATWVELGGFQSDIDTTKKSWDEFVHAIPKMWTEERYGHDGQFFSMPERAVLPKPYQKPHPPMWVAVTSEGTDKDAADRGLGALGVSFNSYEMQEKKVAEYHRRIQQCDPAGATVNEQVAAVNFMYCHEDMQEGMRTGLGMSRHFSFLAAQLSNAKEVYPSKSYPTAGLLPTLRRQAVAPSERNKPPEGLTVGDPDHLVETLKRWESTGLDRVNFVLNAAEVIPQDKVLDSLRLFAAEVMPHFEDKSSGATAAAG